jgi:hypothetical protein
MEFEGEEDFQDQLDFYLKHNRRGFSWYDFHTGHPSAEEEDNFSKLLRHCLKKSGFMIFGIRELWPPTYEVVPGDNDTYRDSHHISFTDLRAIRYGKSQTE